MAVPEIFDTESEFGRGRVLSWASILEDSTRRQAEALSRGHVTFGHVALMPDAHLGRGACIGAAVRTLAGVYPAAVGVDIGCGMIAVETDLRADALDLDARRRLRGEIERRVPSGVGQRRAEPHRLKAEFVETFGWAPSIADGSLRRERGQSFKNQSPTEMASLQFGTLGAGNHFVELAVDDGGQVWAMVHSGSRGIGNNIAGMHIDEAVDRCASTNVRLEDRDLAFLVEGDARFERYIADMEWAQQYAYYQRECMMFEVLEALRGEADFTEGHRVNCHHNYTVRDDEPGVWLTRKGAIDASTGVYGVIPGSMGTDTYVVQGLGNAESYSTAPHGAGRVSSRGRPEKVRRDGSVKQATGAWARFTTDEFERRMTERGVVWQDRDAHQLLDESPMVYKPIEVVMADAADLVEPVTRLAQLVNYKGL